MDARARIKEYFERTIPRRIADDDDIFVLGIVDSLFAMQLVLFVEKEFAISAERHDLDIKNFCSIAALTQFVTGKLSPADRR